MYRPWYNFAVLYFWDKLIITVLTSRKYFAPSQLSTNYHDYFIKTFQLKDEVIRSAINNRIMLSLSLNSSNWSIFTHLISQKKKKTKKKRKKNTSKNSRGTFLKTVSSSSLLHFSSNEANLNNTWINQT